MDLKSVIQNDMKTAMKAQDTVKLGTLRMLFSEIKKREIDKRSPLDEMEIQKLIGTQLKQRHDSIEAFEKGGRTDLADKEKLEAEVLKLYQPQQMSTTEIEAAVASAIQECGAKSAADIGKVMKAVLPKVAGRADGKTINEIVREKLAGG